MAALGDLTIPLFTELNGKRHELGQFTIPLKATAGPNGTVTVTPDLTPMRRALEAMAAADSEGDAP